MGDIIVEGKGKDPFVEIISKLKSKMDESMKRYRKIPKNDDAERQYEMGYHAGVKESIDTVRDHANIINIK